MQKKGIKIELANIADMLMQDISKGDAQVLNARKIISDAISGYSEGSKIYEGTIQTASKYLEMAKALGEQTMIDRLTRVMKDSNEMVKLSNQAITKLKSVLS